MSALGLGNASLKREAIVEHLREEMYVEASEVSFMICKPATQLWIDSQLLVKGRGAACHGVTRESCRAITKEEPACISEISPVLLPCLHNEPSARRQGIA